MTSTTCIAERLKGRIGSIKMKLMAIQIDIPCGLERPSLFTHRAEKQQTACAVCNACYTLSELLAV
jgi:hypothetical protein